MSQHQNSQGISYHENIAQDWDDRYQSGAFKRRLEFTRNTVLKNVQPSGAWLDAGCGSGIFSRMMAQHYDLNFIGIDAAPSMVEQAHSHAKRQNLDHKVKYQKIDTIEALPFEENQFDGAICLSVLEYISNPSQALEELKRVLKKDAKLIISIPNQSSFIRSCLKIAAPILYRNADRGGAFIKSSIFELKLSKARKYLDDHGFELEQQYSFDPYIPDCIHSVFQPSLIYFVCRKA